MLEFNGPGLSSYSFSPTVTRVGAVESHAGACSLPRNLPLTRSPPQSPEMVIRSHHLCGYILSEATNICNPELAGGQGRLKALPQTFPTRLT